MLSWALFGDWMKICIETNVGRVRNLAELGEKALSWRVSGAAIWSNKPKTRELITFITYWDGMGKSLQPEKILTPPFPFFPREQHNGRGLSWRFPSKIYQATLRSLDLEKEGGGLGVENYWILSQSDENCLQDFLLFLLPSYGRLSRDAWIRPLPTATDRDGRMKVTWAGVQTPVRACLAMWARVLDDPSVQKWYEPSSTESVWEAQLSQWGLPASAFVITHVRPEKSNTRF